MVRSFTIAGTMVVAIIVPNFSLFLNLIGAFFGIVIVFVGPPVFHMLILGRANPRTFVLNIVVSVFGGIMCLISFLLTFIALITNN